VKDLDGYINSVNLLSIVVPVWTAHQWEKELPTWPSRDAPRGLKEWRSVSGVNKKGWVVPGVCSKVINMTFELYMKIYAVPPVVEGRVGPNGILQVKPGGIDLFKGFVLTVLTLNTSSKHEIKTLIQNTSSKHSIKTPIQNTSSKHISKTHIQNAYLKHYSKTRSQNICSIYMS
jgi:hypothetical protein